MTVQTDMTVQNSKFKIQNYSLKFKVFIIFLSILTLHFALYTLHLSEANAQSLSLSIWPPLLEVMIQPGRNVTQVYKLTNNSDHDLKITPQIFPFKPQGENGEIKINLPTSSQSPTSQPASRKSPLPSEFFSFESGEKLNQPFYLSIGQTREIVLKITIPKTTPEADYYYTMIFSTTAEPFGKNNLSSTSSITKIGTNILITVSQTGTPIFLGRILEFSSPKVVDSFSPITFTIRLQNWGGAFWKPFGKIKITGLLKQKDEIELLPQNILAESTRKLDIPSFKPKLPLGPFRANLEFFLNESSPSASINEPTKKLSAETVFWYLPYKTLGVIVVLSLIGFLIRRAKNVRPRAKSVETESKT